MRENAGPVLRIIIPTYEGMKLDRDPRDRGNWTDGAFGKNGGKLLGSKMGIAAHVYPQIDIPNITLDDAIAIYKRDYLPKVAFNELPAGVDFTAADASINSGPSRALKWLASALGTASASAKYLAKAASEAPDKIAVIKKANAARRSFLIALHNATYEKGWLKRVANVEARSVKMALEADGKDAKPQLEAEAKAANKQAQKEAAGAGGAVAAPSSTQIPDVPHHVDISSLNKWILAAVIAAIVVGVAVFLWRRHIQKGREAAFAAVAKEG